MMIKLMFLVILLLCVPFHPANAELIYAEKNAISIVQNDGLFGWRFNGDLVQQPVFDYVSPFCANYSIVQKNGLFGIMSMEGDVAVDTVWNSIVMSEDFENDTIVFLYSKQESRIYDLSDKKILYQGESGDAFLGFEEECCIIWRALDGTHRIINTNGDICFQKDISQISPKSNGVFRYEDKEKCGFVNMCGQDICDFDILFCSEMKENRALVLLNNPLSYGLVDSYGNLIPVNYTVSQALFFSEGLLPVEVDKKWGYVDLNGIIALSFEWETATPFSEGLAAVEVNNNKWGFIDKAGNLCIYPIFDKAFVFHEGRALVVVNNSYYFIDKNGLKVGGTWDDASDYSNGRAIAMKGNESYLLDLDGSVVVSSIGIIYESQVFHDLWIIDCDENKYYIDKNGQLIAYCIETIDSN